MYRRAVLSALLLSAASAALPAERVGPAGQEAGGPSAAAATQIVIVLPGQTFQPGVGLTGTPDPVELRRPIVVLAIAVDGANNVAASPEIRIDVQPDEPPSVAAPSIRVAGTTSGTSADTSLVNGSLRLSVNGSAYQEIQLGSPATAQEVCDSIRDGASLVPEFHWGTFQFKCIISSVPQRYTLFTPDGTPLRAKLNTSFRSFEPGALETRSVRVDPAFGSAPQLRLGVVAPSADPNDPADHSARRPPSLIPDDELTSRGAAQFRIVHVDPNSAGSGRTLLVTQPGGTALPVLQDSFTVVAGSFEVQAVTVLGDGNGNVNQAQIHFNAQVDPASLAGNEGDFQLTLTDPNGPSQTISGISAADQLADDLGYPASRLLVAFDSSLPTTSRQNLIFQAGGGSITSLSGDPLSATTLDSTSPSLVDAAPPVLLGISFQDSDSDGALDQATLSFSEAVALSAGRPVSLGGIISGDPNTLSLAAGSQLRVETDGVPGPGLLDRTVTLSDPDDPNAASITGAARIAESMEISLRLSDPGPPLLNATAEFDSFQRRFVLRGGVAGASQTLRVLPASGADAAPTLSLGAANGGLEVAGHDPGVPDLSDLIILSPDGKTNLLAGIAPESLQINPGVLTIGLETPSPVSAGTPLYFFADNLNRGGLTDLGALARPHLPSSNILTRPAGPAGLQPDASGLILLRDDQDADPNDLTLEVSPGTVTLDASASIVPLTAADPAGMVSFRWTQLSGPEPLILSDPNSLVATATLSRAGQHLVEARMQAQPSPPGALNILTDNDGAIRQQFTLEVSCTTDLHCDDGNPCNGAEVCQVSTGGCLPAPAPPVDVCDGIDNDCDGTTDEGQPEICNGIDDDCDGLLPPDEADFDGDGVPSCAADCNPFDPGAAQPPEPVRFVDANMIDPNTVRFFWIDQSATAGPGVTYDVYSGFADDSPGGGIPDSFSNVTCAAENTARTSIDMSFAPDAPTPGFHYRLLRADSSCGASGFDSSAIDPFVDAAPGGCTLSDGATCTGPAECGSGFCTDGLCCDASCAGTCRSCSSAVAGTQGTCQLYPRGTDPESECGAFTCSGAGSCLSSCSSDADCDPGAYCDGGSFLCLPDQGQGATCGSDSQCLSGSCADGFCCDTSCAAACQSCDQSGLEGTCTADPFGSGPSETCDGADNDCDGLTDEGFALGSACTGSGQCGSGFLECDGSGSTRCSTDPGGSADQSSPETCDGLDNDCDGATDGFATSCGTGACLASGTCSGGGDTCSPLPPPGPETCGDGIDNDCDGQTDAGDADCAAAEICDGIDNDLDGLVDEDFGIGQPCVAAGACGGGTLECASPTAARCSAGPGGSLDGSGPELCDGLDNDCDGSTDEACACQDGDTRTCGTGTGECVPGVASCSFTQGGWGSCSGIDPAAESCDGLDNDCDGDTDEGLSGEACLGVGECLSGVSECDGAGGSRCSSMPGGSADMSSPEVCDGLDNDCDGQTDELCPCTPGTTQPCGTDQGTCFRGLQTCTNAGWWGHCNGVGPPVFDSCDGLDNDCDGLTDEEPLAGAAATCGVGECLAPATCSGGGLACTPLSPSPEICDGLDNDCDGGVDEDFGVGQPCDGTGTCGSGVVECLGTGASVCSSGAGGSSDESDLEICDGLDNDCDGQTDEADAGCFCSPGTTQPCGATERGECVMGIQTCEPSGTWGICSGAVEPVPEICDGRDNDCDGSTDEAFGVGEVCFGGGACGSGLLECSGAFGSRCSTAPGGSADASGFETCDGLDNDCDGSTDEEVCSPCAPGEGRPCGSGLGTCASGTWTCSADGRTGTCSAVPPAGERCDGLDNDCDGATDEDYALGETCLAPGVCGGGVSECDGLGGGRCSTAPGGSQDGSSPEICDGLDNDCDGLVDEGPSCACSPGAVQPCGSGLGTCSPGTQTCRGDGTWGDCEIFSGPVAEVCDGLDNDCDGATDEDVTLTTCGTGECLSTGTCSGGADSCTPGSPSAEVCDGLDNDCDGITDNGFGVGLACDGIGTCGSGVLECATGSTVRCSSDAGGTRDASEAEICDGLDNDCDGSVDESCSCADGAVQSCGRTAGACVSGTQTCSGGSWGACSAADPVAESCNGIDDDCDGQTDEGFRIGEACVGGGACGGGVRECAGPDAVRCSTAPGGSQDLSSAEICDGLDNDCDGATDEADAGCSCAPPSTQICGTGLGQCTSGTQTCGTSSGEWGVCTGNEPAGELCDGLDNDCDGVVDEDLAAAFCGIGACRAAASCTGGDLICQPLAPSAETCDGVDDDCDGFTDEEFGIGGACDGVGACGTGSLECDGSGASRCSTDPGGSRDQSATEICDGLDNDCDGLADEGASCFGQGSACDADADCAGGLCRDGFCCDTDCAGSCSSCGIPGSEGTCSPHGAGTDPDGDCGGFVCDGAGSCTTSCSASGDCAAGHYCSGGSCVPQEPPGGACTPTGGECQTGLFCTPEGTCCTSSSCGPGETCLGGTCEPSLFEPPYTSPARAGHGDTGAWPDRYLPSGVHLHSGEAHHTATDLRIRGRGLDFVWTRKYRSRIGTDTAMGNGWDHNYNIRIEPFGSHILLHDGQTRRDIFFLQPDGSWARDGFYSRLALDPNGVPVLAFPDTSRWIFNPLDAAPEAGRIAAIEDRNGNSLSFAYDGSGRLSTVTDTLGRGITVAYDPNTTLITSVTDFAGRSVTYDYYRDGDTGGSGGDLKSATSPAVTGTPNGNDFPSGKTTTYTYSTGLADERLNHNLLTITDPKGQTRVVNTYAATANPADPDFDRLISRVRGGPGDILDFVYVPVAPDPNNGFAVIRSIVNDRVGNVTEYFYDTFNRIVLHRDFTGRADPDLPTSGSFNRPAGKLRGTDPDFFETRFAYNDDAALTLLEHPNGNSTQYVYEADLDPNAPRRVRGNVREIHRLPGLLGGDQPQITELFTYDPGPGSVGTSWVQSHVDGRGNTTSHVHDTRGNRIQTIHRIPTIVEDFQYNVFGQMTGHDWPDNGSGHRRRDIWTYHATGPQTGYLESRVIDPNGFALTTTYEYDVAGNLIRMVDPRGNDTLYTVNALDQVVRGETRPVVTPGGTVRYRRDFFYDENDNLIRVEVENRDDQGLVQPNSDLTTTYEYDILDFRTRVIQEVDPNRNIVTEFEYDDNRNRTLIRKGEAVAGGDPGNTIRVLYDERDLLYREILGEGTPDQSTTQHDYDGNKNRTAVRQGLEGTPRVTTFVYDGYDRVTSSVDPLGNVRLHTYDGNSNRVTLQVDGETVDVAGGSGNVRLFETTYVYDPMDRRTLTDVSFFDTATQSPIGDGLSSTTTAWSDASLILSVTDDNGNATSYAYDTANRLLASTDARSNAVTRAYDDNSNVISVTEVDKSDLLLPDESFVTTYAYDALDRRVLKTDNVSNTDAWAYDSRSNLVLHTDARGNETRTVYDGVNRPVTTIHQLTDTGDGGGIPVGAVTLGRSWDDSWRLVSTTDDNGHVTSYAYDSLDRRTLVSHADGTTGTLAYDVHHNVVTRTDANGNVITTAYDLLDRPVSVSVARAPGVEGTTSESYQYDGLSRVVSAQDDDSLVTRSYDSLSRVTSETQQVLPSGPAQTVGSIYDGVGRLTGLTYPGGRALALSHDALDRVTLVEEAPAGPGADVASVKYIGPRRIERMDYGNGVRYEPSYDGIRRITGTRHVQSATGMPLDDRTYQWDPEHNKTEEQDLLLVPPEQRLYAIDSINRMVQSQVVGAVAETPVDYGLDGAGNRNTVSGGPHPGPYTLDPNIPPADFQVNQYTDTPFDSRLHDDNGNLVQSASAAGPTIQMNYDYRNQMVQHTNVSTSSTVSSAYDCFGRRIQENDGTSVTTFLFLGGSEIEEQDAFGTTLATFVPGVGNQPVLHMTRGGQEHFLHADDLGSIRVLTDPFGNLAESYGYTDFGAPEITDPAGAPLPFSAAGNPFLYRGFRFEEETGLHIVPPPGGRGGSYLDPAPLGSGGSGGSLSPAAGGRGGGPVTIRLDPDAGRTTSRGGGPGGGRLAGPLDAPAADSLGNGLTFAGNNPVSPHGGGPAAVEVVNPGGLSGARYGGFSYLEPLRVTDLRPRKAGSGIFRDIDDHEWIDIDIPIRTSGMSGGSFFSGGTAEPAGGRATGRRTYHPVRIGGAHSGTGVSFRPPTVTPRPVIRGPQTGAVAGKDGEEIWADKYGRVKVQFHWDREGAKDDGSSCWVRLARSWAGATWGVLAIPEIDDEVMVGFQEGNPDRPLVTGNVYHGNALPPSLMPFMCIRSEVDPACRLWDVDFIPWGHGDRDTFEVGPADDGVGDGCDSCPRPCPPPLRARHKYCEEGRYVPPVKTRDWRSPQPLPY